MTYSDAIAAVNNGQYAARDAWPRSGNTALVYIGLNGSAVYIFGQTMGPYTPTVDDEAATDWWSGSDRPPIHP
jgi:hypothetical protein